MRRRSGRIADCEASAISWPSKADRARGRLVDAHDEAREASTCRSRTRRPGRRSRLRDVEIDAVDRVHDLLLAEEALCGSGKCFTRPRTCSSGSPRSASAGAVIHAGAVAWAGTGARVAGGGNGSPDCVTQQRALRSGRKLQQVGMLAALVDAERAARREAAAGRMRERIGRRAFDGHQPPLSRDMPVDARHRVDQRPGVGMARIGQDLPRSAPPRPPRRHTSRSTRAHTLAITPSSWLIRMMAAPKSRLSSTIRSRICAWMVTSSAVVGSSAISSAGSLEKPIASMTRWRMPPENWCG